MYEHLNNENDVTAIKQCKIMEFVNKRNDDEQSIYYATIESLFVDDNGNEKATRYIVGMFAKSIDEANRITNEYMKQGLADLVLVGIRKTKIVDLI